MARQQKTPRWLSAARVAGVRSTEVKEKPDFISRALARAGIMTLKDAEEAIRTGRVRVGKSFVSEPYAPLPPGARVQVDGKDVDITPRTLVMALHKPAGLVVHAEDQHGQGTVFEALLLVLPVELRPYGWHAVGRLDRDTTGVLLFTNDERFVAHATSPESHLAKRYVVKVGGQVTPEKLKKLRTGVMVDGKPTRPAQCELREPQVLVLTLTEGRYHQVKLMTGAVGLPALSLHREAVGQYELDVGVGELRRFTDDEVTRFFGYVPRQSTPSPK